jgi:two-component sensor histidine kinase
VAGKPPQSETEQALRSALVESEVLFAELEHRTKNIMQMIAGLLSVQASRAEHPETKAALRDVMRRVQGLDAAQRALNKLGALDRVELGPFLGAVVQELMALEPRPGVTFEVSAQPVETSVDQASALGLIVNELVTNALKHAFPNRGGEIRLEVGPLGESRGRVVVADNGVGRSEDQPRNGRGLGMTLINALAGQARAELAFTNDAGTRAVVEFPVTQALEPRS